MEKVNFKNSSNKTLVGNFWETDSQKAIILSHGFINDKTELGKFNQLGDALNEEGYNVFAFDFSGAGESDDTQITIQNEVADLKSVIQFVKDKGFKSIGLLGYSLGGIVTIRNYIKDVQTIVLWSPVTEKYSHPYLRYFFTKSLTSLFNLFLPLLKRFDFPKKIPKRKIQITKEIFLERMKVSHKELEKVNCPVLIIHGDKDKSVPLKSSEEAMSYLPESSELKIVLGADHFFFDFLPQYIKLTIEWFNDHLE